MPSPYQDPSRQLGAPVDYYKAVHSAYTNQYLEAQASVLTICTAFFVQAFYIILPFVFGAFCIFCIFCQALGIEPLDRHRRVQLLARWRLHVQEFDRDQNDSGNQKYHLLYSVCICYLLSLFVCLVTNDDLFCQVVSLRAPLQKCTIEAFPAFPTSRGSLSEAQPLVPSSGHLG